MSKYGGKVVFRRIQVKNGVYESCGHGDVKNGRERGLKVENKGRNGVKIKKGSEKGKKFGGF